MTLPQVMHALGLDADQAISPAQAAAEGARRRREMLNKIVRQNGWLAGRLLDVPINTLARMIQSETGGEIEIELLARRVEQYVNDIRQRDLP
jgi:hypothetical protein